MILEFFDEATEDEYLKLALKISNKFLRTNVVKAELKKFYFVDEETAAKMKIIKIIYRKQKKEKDDDEDLLAWTDRSVNADTIYINEIFRNRLEILETKSLKSSTKYYKQKEKEIIVVYLSILLVHELCHLILRWKGHLNSPSNLLEAGENMEYAIFKGPIKLLVHSSSKWDETKNITGIGIEKSELVQLSYRDYIKKIYENSLTIEMYSAPVIKIQKIDKETICKEVSDEKVVYHLDKNCFPIELCGVKRCPFVKY